MDVPKKDEPRREPGRHQKLATIEYGLFSFLSNVTGSVFWWAEQKRWQLADIQHHDIHVAIVGDIAESGAPPGLQRHVGQTGWL